MLKTVLFSALLLGAVACNNDDEAANPKAAGASPTLGAYFKEAALPYQLSDTALQKASDTTTIAPAFVAGLLPDSVKKTYFGKTAIKYTPLARLTQIGKETYYMIKASAGQKRGAVIAVTDASDKLLTSYSFLFPDADAATTQTTTIDKKFTITKTVTQRSGSDVVGEGKEVVAYDAASNSFSLIMMDVLQDNPDELKNPIDTFPKTNKLAGDYYLNKKGIVAVRDGRYANQLLVYIHTENNDGDCIGQLKGEFIITSSTTAAYRQGGDPCVLGLTFKGNTVSIAEQSGCGNYRGLDCPLTGIFTRKKPQSAKPATAKPKRK